MKEGIICICAGGGGIPVALEQEEGGTQWRRHGVEAVIDKVIQETQMIHIEAHGPLSCCVLEMTLSAPYASAASNQHC